MRLGYTRHVEQLTPIRRQYLDVKRRYPHAIVFFRLGDFYETFDDDAELCSRELDITLTSKPMGKGLRVPLAGIPYHAVDGYVAKLIAKGYKVALCEQMSDPATTKGHRRAAGRARRDAGHGDRGQPARRAGEQLSGVPGARRTAARWRRRCVAGRRRVGVRRHQHGRVRGGRAVAASARRPSWRGIRAGGGAAAGGRRARRRGSTPALHVTRVEPLWFDADLATVTVQEHFRVASPEAFGIDRASAGGGGVRRGADVPAREPGGERSG